MKEVFVLQHNGLTWKLSEDGYLTGYGNDVECAEYRFMINAPPRAPAH